jgi:hypothetical protein
MIFFRSCLNPIVEYASCDKLKKIILCQKEELIYDPLLYSEAEIKPESNNQKHYEKCNRFGRVGVGFRKKPLNRHLR